MPEPGTGNREPGAEPGTADKSDRLFEPRAFVYLRRALLAALGLLLALPPVLQGQEYLQNLPVDHPAIRYGAAPAHDEVGRLREDLAQGRARWEPKDDARGYLPVLLDRLQVPVDSQMLVFSKTSVQAARVSPATPRAVYFNDTVAVAYVPGAPSLEIIATDPGQGSIFYTLDVASAGRPSITRRHTCLQCHQGPNTAGVPGLYVGSVIPGPTGAPLRDESAIITDHRSAFAERWGGWYVTARRGEQRDRANAVASNPADPATLVRDSRQNLPSLSGLFDLSRYPAPTSDIVALMVFEHQTQMTNLLTRVSWQARMALHADPDDDLTEGPVASDIEALVDYMLFADEAPLVEPIEGVSAFTQSFAARGPRDAEGRSLRDFDLQTRMFRYPLSYMIYSAAFDALPDAARLRVYRRLFDRLSGGSDTIIRILRSTKRGLPASWLRIP